MVTGTSRAQGLRSTTRLVVDPDREVLRAYREARQNVTQEHYQAAASLFQFILDRSEDNFLEPDFLEERGMAGGLRQDVVRQLMALPAAGRDAYELESGGAARALLESALEQDDPAGLQEITRRYLATAAGYTAAVRLAALAADGDHPLQAALLLESIRNHPRKTAEVTFQRAVYWTRSGRLGRGLAALRELTRPPAPATIQVRGRAIAIPTAEDEATRLLQSFARTGPDRVPVLEDWSMPRGGPSRNVSSLPASPIGGDIWRTGVVDHMTLDGRPDVDARHRVRVTETLERVQRLLKEEGRPLLVANQPLVVGSTVVYRTPADITAVNLTTGELQWRSAVVDESLIRFLNTRGTDSRVRNSGVANLHAATLEGYLERRTFRDVTAGSLSSDGTTVFALEGLDGNFVALTAFGAPETRPANKLAAYDLEGGLLLWEIGGQRGSRPVELASTYFLGPPLTVGNRLYILAETQGTLKLLVLVQDAARQSVSLEWSQTLIATDPPLTGHPLRRLSGLTPSFDEGVLVCPTSSGAVVAVDAARRALLWGYQYPSLVPPGVRTSDPFDSALNQEFRLEEVDRDGHWVDSTAIVTEGKVLLTPRDSDQLHCLDLVDGHELWSLPRETWMYVACVHQDKVVLVGQDGIGAVRLEDGTAIDTFANADIQPTGRGVRIGATYCVPTAAGEIATLDLNSGAVLARSRLTDGRIPGNLVAGSGAIISQSATEIVGFPELSTIERQIARLGTTPEDPRALALRGELRLHQGQEAAGLADLRESLQAQPDAHVKSVLATALLAAVRIQPNRVLEFANELETVADAPQNRNEFLQFYAQALESRGDRLAAFRQRIRLANTAQYLSQMTNVDAGYSRRADRELRARLIELYEGAPPDERAQMDIALEAWLKAHPPKATRNGDDRFHSFAI